MLPGGEEKLGKVRTVFEIKVLIKYYIVHTPVAEVAKIMHLAVCPCVLPYIKVLLC